MKKTTSVMVLTLVFLFCFMFQGCTSDEKKAAQDAFTNEVTRLTNQFAERDTAVQSAQAIVDSGEKAYVDAIIPALETAISNAKAVNIELPEMPSKLEDIKSETEKLKAIDCTESLNALAQAKQNAEYSIQREKLVTAPTEAYVIERLRTVDGVKDISAVTETNDPNGNLNKQGGYTAQVFFSSPWINQSEVYGDSLIDKGTEAGGSIEVYRTKEEATTRETYLAAFDGGILASGSHKVIGSVLVRTSDKLTASQQKELESKLIQALIHLDVDDVIKSTAVTQVGDVWGVFKEGTLDESYTGIATNNAGQWYVKDGKVDFGFSGELAYAGLLYDIVGGKVQSNTGQTATQLITPSVAENANTSQQNNTNSNTQVATNAQENATASSGQTTVATTMSTSRAASSYSTTQPTTAFTSQTMAPTTMAPTTMAPTVGEW